MSRLGIHIGPTFWQKGLHRIFFVIFSFSEAELQTDLQAEAVEVDVERRQVPPKFVHVPVFCVEAEPTVALVEIPESIHAVSLLVEVRPGMEVRPEAF